MQDTSWTEQTGLLPRCAVMLAVIVCGTLWLKVVRQQEPGMPRLLVALPLIFLQCVVPFTFNPVKESVSFGITTFLTVWLNNCKVLALVLNRGPFSVPRPFLHDLALYAMPISAREETVVVPAKGHAAGMVRSKSAGRVGDEGGSWLLLASKCAAKLAVLGVATHLLLGYRDELPRMATSGLYSIGLYCLLGAMMDGPASLATSAIGLKVSPHFDRPFLSASVQEFWGRRWNITASNTLRALFYDPICEGRLVRVPGSLKPPSLFIRLLGACACFVASGVLHEIVFWYMMGFATGKWMLFFSLQGPVVAAETAVRSSLKQQRLMLPRWLAIPLTLGLLLWVGNAMFFPPATDTEMATRVLTSCHEGFASLLSLFR